MTAYKNLRYVERDFRHIKADDLDLRPGFHRLEERVKAHVLICMLACYLTWHLRPHCLYAQLLSRTGTKGNRKGMTMADGCVSVSRRIEAPAERLFALLADSANHPLIDGSGMVRGRPRRSGCREPVTRS